MSEYYGYGEAPKGFGESQEFHAQQAEKFAAFKDCDFEEDDNNPRKSVFDRIMSSKITPFVGFGVGIGLAALGVNRLDSLIERAEKVKQAEVYNDENEAALPVPPSIDFQPPQTTEPKIDIDFFEIAAANAGMVDMSLMEVVDGALQHVRSGGGGLFVKNDKLFFATARSVLAADSNKNETLVVRATVPVGVGHDPVEFVMPLQGFSPAEENPEVLQALVDDNGGMLAEAMNRADLFPLLPTVMHKNVGYTVVGNALQESPLMDERGFVLRRTLRHETESRWEATFMTDEPSCDSVIQIGDFVLNSYNDRLFSESYGVVVKVGSEPDPHHPDSCITFGKIALNAFVEETTI